VTFNFDLETFLRSLCAFVFLAVLFKEGKNLEEDNIFTGLPVRPKLDLLRGYHIV